MQQDNFNHGQEDVDHPQRLGRMGDAGRDLLLGGPGGLGKKHLPSGHGKLGENGHKEDDDPHAAKPLTEAAPEKERLGVGSEILEDGRSGGGKAGDGLKVGIKRPQLIKQVGNRADTAGDQPGQGYDQHALGPFEMIEVPGKTTVPLEDQPQDHAGGAGHHKGHNRTIFRGEQGHGDRREHDRAQGDQNNAENVEDGGKLHQSKAALMASASLAMVKMIN